MSHHSMVDAAWIDYEGIWDRISELMDAYGTEFKWTPERVEYAWTHGVSNMFPDIVLRQRQFSRHISTDFVYSWTAESLGQHLQSNNAKVLSLCNERVTYSQHGVPIKKFTRPCNPPKYKNNTLNTNTILSTNLIFFGFFLFLKTDINPYRITNSYINSFFFLYLAIILLFGSVVAKSSCTGKSVG